MHSSRFLPVTANRDQAEKPFWISYADLMTALMVLFLVAMSIALLVITRQLEEQQRFEIERDGEIAEIMKRIEQRAQAFPGINVDAANYRIDFGDLARFERARWDLRPEAATLLRRFVPEVLAVVGDAAGGKWIKQIVVEGFTDSDGSYLFNLDLSLKRGHRVLCALFEQPGAGERAFTPAEIERIRELFQVGGYSFNSVKATKEASRRIELRIEFLELGEARLRPSALLNNAIGDCRLR